MRLAVRDTEAMQGSYMELHGYDKKKHRTHGPTRITKDGLDVKDLEVAELIAKDFAEKLPAGSYAAVTVHTARGGQMHLEDFPSPVGS